MEGDRLMLQVSVRQYVGVNLAISIYHLRQAPVVNDPWWYSFVMNYTGVGAGAMVDVDFYVYLRI